MGTWKLWRRGRSPRLQPEESGHRRAADGARCLSAAPSLRLCSGNEQQGPDREAAGRVGSDRVGQNRGAPGKAKPGRGRDDLEPLLGAGLRPLPRGGARHQGLRRSAAVGAAPRGTPRIAPRSVPQPPPALSPRTLSPATPMPATRDSPSRGPWLHPRPPLGEVYAAPRGGRCAAAEASPRCRGASAQNYTSRRARPRGAGGEDGACAGAAGPLRGATPPGEGGRSSRALKPAGSRRGGGWSNGARRGA